MFDITKKIEYIIIIIYLFRVKLWSVIMIEKFKIYISNFKICFSYYFISAIAMYLINIPSKKSIMNTEIAIDKSELIKTIIMKNTVCFLWILSGIVLGKLLIKMFLVVNGIVMGLLISKFVRLSQLLLILPHGIIEIGALIFTCCIVCVIIQQKYVEKYEVVYLTIAYLFIIQAAIIETFFTTSLIKFF